MLSLSIHSDLQLFSHNPQRVHFDSSIRILNNENFDNKPSAEPTGQTVLQYNLPRNHDMTPINTKKNNDMPNVSNTKLM
jgi:hypothetical protein